MDDQHITAHPNPGVQYIPSGGARLPSRAKLDLPGDKPLSAVYEYDQLGYVISIEYYFTQPRGNVYFCTVKFTYNEPDFRDFTYEVSHNGVVIASGSRGEYFDTEFVPSDEEAVQLSTQIGQLQEHATRETVLHIWSTLRADILAATFLYNRTELSYPAQLSEYRDLVALFARADRPITIEYRSDGAHILGDSSIIDEPMTGQDVPSRIICDKCQPIPGVRYTQNDTNVNNTELTIVGGRIKSRTGHMRPGLAQLSNLSPEVVYTFYYVYDDQGRVLLEIPCTPTGDGRLMVAQIFRYQYEGLYMGSITISGYQCEKFSRVPAGPLTDMELLLHAEEIREIPSDYVNIIPIGQARNEIIPDSPTIRLFFPRMENQPSTKNSTSNFRRTTYTDDQLWISVILRSVVDWDEVTATISEDGDIKYYIAGRAIETEAPAVHAEQVHI